MIVSFFSFLKSNPIFVEHNSWYEKLFTLLVLFTLLNGYAQQDFTNLAYETKWDMFKYDFGNMFKGIGYSYARPFHWQSKQWA